MSRRFQRRGVRVALIFLSFAAALTGYGLAWPLRSEMTQIGKVKTGRLTDRQMMSIMGGGQGCETFTDSTSCGWTNLVVFTDHCNQARGTTIMSEQQYNDSKHGKVEPGEYAQYKADRLPTCDFWIDLSITAGDGSSFETARIGSDTTKNLKQNGVHPCKRGHQCKNEKPPEGGWQVGTVRDEDGEERPGCVESDDPNSYCVSCTSNGGQIMPDAAQPKKYACENAE